MQKKILALLVALSVSFSAMASPCVKIGIIGEFKHPTDGYTRYFGREVRYGVETALNELKAKHQNFCAETKIIETNNSLADIQFLIKKYSKEGIHLFIGLGNSDQAIAAIPALQEGNSILITPTASDDGVLKGGHTITFFPIISSVAAQLTGYLAQNRVKRVAIIYTPNRVYSKKMIVAFSKAFENSGGQIVARYPVQGGAVSLKPYAKQLRDLNTKYYFMPMHTKDTTIAMLQLYKLGLKPRFIGTDAWATYDSIPGIIQRAIKKKVNAVVPVLYRSDMNTKRNKHFVRMFKLRYPNQHITDMNAFSYDAIFLLQKMLKSCSEEAVTKEPLVCLHKALPFSSTVGMLYKTNGLSMDPRVIMKHLPSGKNLHK